ncbi:hypothetical protein JIR001_07760 [Polycladomyces abyssicola]|jgi:hypothetical protein|uniref:Uncharacterized protein n=1 Tax=Polycladomyces abyssicola TaxID=1125966 RepID=A0A8D5UEX7_9BACL|nr:hypothetical protein [Polycladomyces abyssicola]BCU80993.1 hypothetical protein JIR001_07760 [Polycladomyces abyssicola]
MENVQNLKHTLSYIQSELNRIETMAGTLSSIERDHFNKLTKFDHRELGDIAVEEQHAARQLGTIKHMCLSMAQQIEDIRNTIEGGGSGERTHHDEVH